MSELGKSRTVFVKRNGAVQHAPLSFVVPTRGHLHSPLTGLPRTLIVVRIFINNSCGVRDEMLTRFKFIFCFDTKSKR